MLASDMNYISALADGYAYKSASEEKRTIAEMFGNGSLESFSVEKNHRLHIPRRKKTGRFRLCKFRSVNGAGRCGKIISGL
ncbi:MAG: hypothetical protein L6V93_05105 [Clostridiales bacterium]|nr:MAG: hypothetical protein L6V93_05105 [Clostridiales bacterium]